ncbi:MULTISPECIES: lipopolysaccharide biosynthesis protein [unclassified Streptomyces]|uniref:lipopolysaccharide biosynthesis protein n=1 Tax=unclassified Streptomyces TaxID=2593676 RepID=UPI000823AE1F|nr:MULTISPECIES: lipopolysaccharide biosynthesis protein [unclassified Streptomyces]MYT98970.1 lipopolysaccharide biosynthesis protein [Streptomyces sp. SID8350]SCK23986.1 Capsular polysaccharide biosynthesis protein [Streptomyces sp. AmelKG-D3]
MTDSPEKQRPSVTSRRLRTVLTRLPQWWPLPACVLLGTVSGLSYGLLASPQYESTSYAMAVAEDETNPAAALGFAQSFGRLVTSDATLSYAQGAAGEPVRALRSQVRSETSPDSPMIAVTGTSDKPGKAADIANAVIEAVIVSSGHVSKDTGVKLIKFTHAMKPDQPVSPSVPLGTAVGAAAGGLLGGLVLLVRPRRTERAVSAPVPAPAAAEGHAPAEERELVR